MSTETTEETTSTELPANLVKLASAELHERAAAIIAKTDEALEVDDWETYKSLSAQEDKLRAEIERRGEAARKATPVEPAKVPVAAQERIEQTRQQLAEAEEALAAFGAVKSRPDGTPPPWGTSVEDADQPTREKAEAFTNVEKLRADLFAMEARTAFIDIEDSEIASDLEDTAIRMEDLRIALKTATAEGRRAAAAKAERELAEATEAHYALVCEDGVRRDERTKESVLGQLAARRALKHRETALRDWTNRKTELEAELQRDLREGESSHFDVGPLREAAEAVESITKMIAEDQPIAAVEIAQQRATLEANAPHVRGSFRD